MTISTGSFFSYAQSIKTPLFLVECSNPTQNKLFRDTINQHHSYCSYKDSPTRNIRWLIYETQSGNLLGAIGLSSATIAVAARDKYIGWNNVQRMKNLGQLANNSRFCLIPGVSDMRNIGSMVLKQLHIVGSKRWYEKYGQELIMLETFVQPERNGEYNGYVKRIGTVYRASNWIEVGKTSGNHIRKTPLKLWAREKGERGRLARDNPTECLKRYAGYLGEGTSTNGYNITKSSIKIMFIKPLISDWKERLML